jgi:hypothetical protein
MTISWDQRSLVEDVVARGVDDWIDLNVVVSVAGRAVKGDSLGELTAASLGLVTVLIIQELVRPGAIEGGGLLLGAIRPTDRSNGSYPDGLPSALASCVPATLPGCVTRRLAMSVGERCCVVNEAEEAVGESAQWSVWGS